MSQLIGITEEELNSKLEQHAGLVAKNILANLHNYLPAFKIDKRYRLNDPIVAQTFPSLTISTLKKWCSDGKLGKMGADGNYHVTLAEIERKLFKL